ncbi:MAG: circadian clock KaiB family protein [Bacteroidia bacterium]
MPKKKPKIEQVEKNTGEEKYILRLFVTGILPNSVRAIKNIKAICEEHLKGRYELEIIDIYQQPEFSLKENIIAIPLLVKKFPLPEERVIGDLSNTEKVLEGLHLI